MLIPTEVRLEFYPRVQQVTLSLTWATATHIGDQDDETLAEGQALIEDQHERAGACSNPASSILPDISII
jgi:hypothetical protein